MAFDDGENAATNKRLATCQIHGVVMGEWCPCDERAAAESARQQPAGGATLWTDDSGRDLYDYIVELANLAPPDREADALRIGTLANELYIRIRAEAMWLTLGPLPTE